MGAWIETGLVRTAQTGELSPPAWGRGLKPFRSTPGHERYQVAPRVGAWIETERRRGGMHIEAAVRPLKEEAIDRAVSLAEKIIREVKEELARVEWDANKVAPMPSSHMSTATYRQGKTKYTLYRLVTKPLHGSRRLKDPDVRVESKEHEDRFLAKAREDAALSYEAFILKMVEKIGKVESAKLTGTHVWGYSFLDVVKEGGLKERWKTSMIVNVSKYGLLFNQFPSRKVGKRQPSASP